MAFYSQLKLSAFFLVVALAYFGSSCEQEDYWKMKLPKVPMPQSIRDNLLCEEYDEVYVKEESKDVIKWKDDVSIQPATVIGWKYKDEKIKEDVAIQPVTVIGWKYKQEKIKEIDNTILNHEDLSSTGSLFFVEKSLHIGNKLKHDFQITSKVPFLPKHVIELIPFEVNKFQQVIDFFSISNESAQATAIKETLGICLERAKSMKENRTCAQSMEDVVDFVIRELGTNNVKLRMMDNNIEVPNDIQDYVITKVNKLKVSGNNGVACHRMSYPYVVYYCHHQQDIGQYNVTLVNTKLGNPIQTTAVCHYDTYAWQPNVPALKYLGIHPGDAPICHFSAINDMFWSLNDVSKDLDMVQ